MNPAVVLLIVIALFLFVYVASGVRIVRPYQRGVIEQLGKFKTTVNPGLQLIIPFIQSVRLVDMREQVIDVPPQEVITKDNVVVSVDAVIYYEPTDPQRLIYNVGNFILAITKLAQTNLRNLVGEMQLDEALTSRDSINLNLRQILDDATDKWGVRVVRVEIQRIDPPPDVVDSMHNQMRAERHRRATVTEAQGAREAAITRAEGEKQAAILDAQGRAEAIERLADAERLRQIRVAEGEADAIRNVFQAIHDGDPTPDLLTLKYLDALRVVANGRATKIFLPAEAQGLLSLVSGLAEMTAGPAAGDPEAEPGSPPGPNA